MAWTIVLGAQILCDQRESCRGDQPQRRKCCRNWYDLTLHDRFPPDKTGILGRFIGPRPPVYLNETSAPQDAA
jgi:hypothetical protein